MKSGEIVCLSCGHIQERKLYAKTRARCSVCHSRSFGGLNNRGELEKVTVGHRAKTNQKRKGVVTKEEEKGEWQSLEKKINDTTDNRRIGTVADISMPPFSAAAEVKKKDKEGNEGKKKERERRESWWKNELLHQQGRREETGLIREAAQLIGSMVSEKNPRGHGSKAINHAFRIAEIKRQINEEGGDTRLLGENTRKLTGDNDSLFGFGITKFGKGGIIERFRRKE